MDGETENGQEPMQPRIFDQDTGEDITEEVWAEFGD